MRTIDTIVTYLDGKEEKVTYAINSDGNGLFVYKDGAYRQLKGTCDFTAKTPADLSRKLKKYFEYIVKDIRMIKNSAEGW